MEWLSRNIPKLESWEDVQDTKTNQGASTLGRVVVGLGRVVARLGRTVAFVVFGAILGVGLGFAPACLLWAVILFLGFDPDDEPILGIGLGGCAVIGATWGAAAEYLGGGDTVYKGSKPPVQISDDERYEFSDYQKALRDWEYQQKSYWTNASGLQFEKRLTKLLNNLGWTAKTTKASGDGGYDIVATCPKGTLYWIQCKNWEKRCGVEPIRLLAGTLSIEGTTATGIVTCTGGFTASAEASARKAGIRLWDLDDVMTLVNTPK